MKLKDRNVTAIKPSMNFINTATQESVSHRIKLLRNSMQSKQVKNKKIEWNCNRFPQIK